jgi:PQQ-like domain
MKIKTINKVFLILLLSLVSSPLFAQIDTFVQKVTGAGTLTSTVRAADGGYVTASRINRTSFLIRKIKVSGQKQWERRLNFDTLDFTFASINGIAQTTDGGFILAGQSGPDYLSFDTGGVGTLVKLRSNGTVAWQKSFDFFPYYTWFSSVIATPDGGVIAVGTTAQSRVAGPSPYSLVVNFAATGDVVWSKSFKRIAASPVFFRIPLITSTATHDNGFIVAFATSANVNNRPLNGVDVMKITNSGNVVWEKSLKTGPAFVFQSAGKTAAGGVILIGTGPNSNKLKVVVLKANGTLSWSAGYSLKVPGSIRSVSSPAQTPDGGYVVTGGLGTYGFVAEIDSSRKIAFQNTLQASEESVFATPDGGFVLFGNSGLGILVSKVDSKGIVPGCSFINSLGTTTRTSFGPLKIGPVKITAPNDLSLEPADLGLTSVVTNHPVSTVCQ